MSSYNYKYEFFSVNTLLETLKMEASLLDRLKHLDKINSLETNKY